MTDFVENIPWIDPILHRPEQEKKSVRTALYQFFAQSCSNVPKSEMYQGGDVSQWQGEMDWNKFFDNGMNYAIIRAMINGRADTQYDRNLKILVDQERKFLCYGATGYPTNSNAIPYARALADLVRGVPYLGIWWDSEMSGLLTPYEMARYNSDVMGELAVQLPGTILEIYTRQSFWDSSVLEGNWDKYPLAAARYNEQLLCPWSDGRFKFRDWDDWRYWQLTQCWDGYLYGAESRCIDGDLFNGNEEMFNVVYGVDETPEYDCCEEHTEAILELEDNLLALTTKVFELQEDLENHTHSELPPVEPPPPSSDTITVKITEKHKAHYFADTDNSCEDDPVNPSSWGKPYMLTDDNKPPFIIGQRYYCQASLYLHCKDTASSPTTIANGGSLFYRIVEEGTYKGRFIRKDKSEKV